MKPNGTVQFFVGEIIGVPVAWRWRMLPTFHNTGDSSLFPFAPRDTTPAHLLRKSFRNSSCEQFGGVWWMVVTAQFDGVRCSDYNAMFVFAGTED